MQRILILSLIAGSLFSQTITISPGGEIKTLTAARDAARAQRKTRKTGTITIQIQGGTYFLPETLMLEPEDSDTIWQAAPGAHPIISGGRVIKGWKKGEGNLWTAEVSAPVFHQLFIDGRRATRARTPNYGFFRIDGASPQDKPAKLHFRGNDIKKEWAERGDVEVVALMAWSDLRMPIVSVDPAARIATLASAPQPSNKEVDARYYIENAPDALDIAGEWYYDKMAHKVSYRPLNGEDMERAVVIAPMVEQLVRLQGKPESGQFVKNVVFRGLNFAHAEWKTGEKGYADTQAALPAPSAIEGVGAIDCRIDRSTIANSGGYAVFFGRGSKRNQITATEIFDMGAGGIKIGEPEQRKDDADQNYENVVADNNIHDLGKVYAAGIGVWVLQSSRNQIVHNHVHDLYYTAISVGWTWGYGPNQSKGSLIAFNHLHSIGKDMLSDMGGIYTLGIQPGTIIRNNLIHDISSFTYGGWGIYPDEGSSEILIENNIVYGCKSAGFHQHYGRENIVRNNIFALNRESQLMRTRAEPHKSFTLERNIIYFEQGQLLGKNWTGSNFTLDNNVYYDRRGPGIHFAEKSFAEWQASGQDKRSIVADPLFVNVSNFDFRLRPNSPALKMGFQQIDMSKVGPRAPTGADAQ